MIWLMIASLARMAGIVSAFSNHSWCLAQGLACRCSMKMHEVNEWMNEPSYLPPTMGTQSPFLYFLFLTCWIKNILTRNFGKTTHTIRKTLNKAWPQVDLTCSLAQRQLSFLHSGHPPAQECPAGWRREPLPSLATTSPAPPWLARVPGQRTARPRWVASELPLAAAFLPWQSFWWLEGTLLSWCFNAPSSFFTLVTEVFLS